MQDLIRISLTFFFKKTPLYSSWKMNMIQVYGMDAHKYLLLVRQEIVPNDVDNNNTIGKNTNRLLVVNINDLLNIQFVVYMIFYLK